MERCIAQKYAILLYCHKNIYEYYICSEWYLQKLKLIQSKNALKNTLWTQSGSDLPALQRQQIEEGCRFTHIQPQKAKTQEWKLYMEAECALRYTRAAEISGTIPGVHLCNWKQNAGICFPFRLNVQ